MAKNSQLKTDAERTTADTNRLLFAFRPPFGPEDWQPEAPPHLHAAMQWAMKEVGLADAKHQVELILSGSDLAPSKRDELRRRIRLVLEIQRGTRNRKSADRIIVDLTPPKPTNRKRAASASRVRSTAVDELTPPGIPREPRPMREGRNREKPTSTNQGKTDETPTVHRDPLAVLHELASPKPKPQDIVDLENLLATAGKVRAERNQKFVDDVNAIVDRNNYCFRLEPDKAISRKLYLNEDSSEDGDIQFQMTKGGLRGFVKAEYELIPYSRPSHD
jgi:hypothetical protein